MIIINENAEEETAETKDKATNEVISGSLYREMVVLVVERRINMSFEHAAIILDTGEGKIVSALGNSYTYKASGNETGGGYALQKLERTTKPG
jgi:hypothetical protein